MAIVYKYNEPVKAEDAIEVFRKSGLTRPLEQKDRIQKMLDQANLVITAWDDDRVVGIARGVTDYSYCCYLSELAVDRDYQKVGIGKELLQRVKEAIGDEVSLLLLATPEAMGYYPKVGFDKIENGFIIPRKK